MSTRVHRNDIAFDFESGKWEGITIEQVKFWENAYPSIDVVDILTKKIPAWLSSNPEKANKKKWKRFINNWLSRQQARYDEICFTKKVGY